MKVGIHKARYGKLSPFLLRYEDILNHNNIENRRIEVSDLDFWEQLTSLDLFLYRWQHFHDEHQIAKTIIPIIEKEMKVNCFPNMATCWHYDDKIRQYYLLKQYGYPMIKSWIFWSRKSALSWLQESAEFPLVFKLKGGAGSSNVVLINNISEAKKLVRIMFGRGIKSGRLPTRESTRWQDFNLYKEMRRWGGNLLRLHRGEDIYPYWQVDKNYVYFQEFMPENKFDTRVTIIGDRAFAFRRMNRKNDFRSSGSGVMSYDINEINLEFIKIAFDISKTLGFQSMAYDFIYSSSGEAKFCEISYDYLDTTVYMCPGYWDVDLNFNEGNFWPQYCQLSDALCNDDMKQPDLECKLPSTIKIL